jgi:hypothetical protein
MTSKTAAQIKIEYESNVHNSKDKIFKFFKDSGFIDCKINAFPFNTEHFGVDLEVKNKTAATFIMIDLDLNDFENKSKEKLDKHLKKTLNKLALKFKGDAYPTVLWTGNGYHIYQPIAGIVFEDHQIFYDFLPYLDNRDLTTEFLRFAEKFFTRGKSDPKHMPSIKSCLIRIPGTINPKNGGQQVRVIQKWNGKRPAIQWITPDFRDYLIQKRIDKIKEKGKGKSSFNKPYIHINNKIEWIETLLQTPIADHRKYCLWRILIPYLVNIRKLSNEDSTKIASQWLQKCDQLKKIDFNSSIYIKNNLKKVKEYLPSSREKLKKDQPELYDILKLYNIVDE